MNISIADVVQKVRAIEIVGDENQLVNELKAMTDPSLTENSLFWCSDKNAEDLKKINAGIGIVSSNAYASLKEYLIASNKTQWIVVQSPRKYFMDVLNEFFVDKPVLGQIHPSAIIHPSVKYDSNEVNIGANVIIENGVVLGKGVHIGHNTIIKQNCVLHDHVKLGCNNTIGGIGFGYELNNEGKYESIPHIGNVILHKNAEIGNNSCIDRAVLGSTIIGANVKIDNLVHIAHGVEIGENSLIIANSMIAGSTKIGKNVWVSPSSSIIQKINIDDDSLIGMGSVVVKDVEKSTVVVGVPAKKIKTK